MIRFAKKEDLIQLKEIWRECFHDEEHYIDFFYEHHVVEKVTLIYIQDGRAVSMLNLIPGRMMIEDKYQEIRYVYAVATLPKYQGQGMAGKLLNHANQWLQNQNILTILVPADEKLFKYYERLGYKTYFYMSQYKLPLNMEKEELMSDIELGKQDNEKEYGSLKTASIDDASTQYDYTQKNEFYCSDITPKEYKEIRDQHFLHEGYVVWNEEEISYAMKENEMLSGETKKVTIDGVNHVIMYYVHNHIIYIRETTINKNFFPNILKHIGSFEHCDNAHIRMLEERREFDNAKPYGMIYNRVYKGLPRKSYLNLALD